MKFEEEKLNTQQRLAVEHVEGPLLVLAGAGSGKTRIVTYRVVHLLEMGAPASEILAVTFTNKAAEEMRNRIQQLSHSSILTCTFHSLCARILRESISALGYSRDFIIFDEDDAEKVLRECLSLLDLKDEKGLLKNLRSQISQVKNNLNDLSHLADENELLAKVYHLYQKRLKEYNALDFDDLLFLVVELFRKFPDVLETYQNRWSFILIDEYQDTNAAQYTLTKLLAAKHLNVFAVGDPDQSIYSWRGANIHNILNFEKDYPGAKILSLEQNYRSCNRILKAANALIQHNSSRYEKNLWSALEEGEKIGLYICRNEHEETDFVVKRLLKHHEEDLIPLRECVVFYRTNFQSRAFEDALLKQRIPYVIIGGLSFYQRREIKDLLSLLRMILGGADFLSFSRTINLPKRGIGENTLDKLRNCAQEQGLDFLSTSIEILNGKLPFKLSSKQFEGLKEYVGVILELRELWKKNTAIHEIIERAMDRSRYLEYLKEDPETYQERKENLSELVSKATEWEQETQNPSLAAFLEELSLKSSSDEKDPSQDSVRLMTLHHGKGLEFTVVFIVGMEEDLFPLASAQENLEALEEERRLCYVGMTRAKKQLYMTASRYRFLWGMPRTMRPSRFLKEIPSDYLRNFHAATSMKEIERTSYEDDEISFQPGTNVFHKDFGCGIIQKAYHTSLGLTYDVHFPKTQILRTLVAKYAKLKALD